MGSQNLKSKINVVLRCNYFFKITLVQCSEKKRKQLDSALDFAKEAINKLTSFSPVIDETLANAV